MNKEGMNVLSLFDGISCGQQALKEIGVPVNKYYSSEVDKYAISITQHNFPNTIQLGDIEKWREWNIDWSGIDLVQGGFPCQSYSQAGKRKGLQDKRGDLIHTVFDILKHSRVPQFMLENVKGLLTHDKGATFEYILSELNKCGYAVDWIIINSAKVSAQNRERVYILGKRIDLCQGSVYHIEYDKAKQAQKESTDKSVVGTVSERVQLPTDSTDIFDEQTSSMGKTENQQDRIKKKEDITFCDV